MDRRQRLGLVLGPALAVAAFLAAGALPLPARGAAATVVLMACWWITEPVPLWVTALLPLPLFPVFGAAPLREIALQYLDPVNFLFLGGMWIAAAMEQHGLHRRMALAMVARIGTGPRQIVLGFMLATGFISLWISNTAAALMMFPIAMAVLQRFEEQLGRDEPLLRRFGMALMLGIGYAASMGGIGSKIGTGTNLVFVKHASGLIGRDVTFVEWFQIGLPVVVLAIPLAWLYLTRVAARLPAADFPGRRETIAAVRRQLGPMGRGEAVALAAFLTAAVLWVFRQPMDFGALRVPGWAEHWPWSWSDVVGGPVARLPPPFAELLGPRGAEGVVAMLVALALLATPIGVRPWRAALSPRQAARISWGLLALLGGGFAMAYGIQRSGLSPVLGGALEGMSLGAGLPVLVLVCLLTTGLSEVASNTATASILLPLLGPAAPQLGLHPATLGFAVTLSASFGFMLPAGTPPNAVVFSSGYIRVTEMARSGLAVDVAGAVVIATVCYHAVPLALGLR